MHAVYGIPPPALAQAAPGAVQVSPMVPGAAALDELGERALASMIVAAPSGTLERRHVLAHGLRALEAGGALTALAAKTRGGARLAAELRAFGCEVGESARRHHRICVCQRPASPEGVEEAIAAGGPQIAPRLGLWSQPGVFSWDRLDPGTALLLQSGLSFTGRGADIGCGTGVLARAVLEAGAVSGLTLIDIDRRAVEAARRNIADPRALFLHADARARLAEMADLDFVVMNPPFHHEGRENRFLGPELIASAAHALRKGGRLRLVANVALPYERILARDFSKFAQLSRGGGYKVLEAVK